MFDVITRVAIALLYLGVAASFAAVPTANQLGRAFKAMSVVASSAWVVWYLYLAFGSPDPFGWAGTFNRLVHLPLALYLVVSNRLIAKFYNDNPKILELFSAGVKD